MTKEEFLKALQTEVLDYNKIRTANPLDLSAMKNEYRIIGGIPSKYFEAVLVPFSETKNQRFKTLEEYYFERLKEIQIIREILSENNILIPILDTRTLISLEDDKKINRLMRVK